jgi:hypothetical protein
MKAYPARLPGQPLTNQAFSWKLFGGQGMPAALASRPTRIFIELVMTLGGETAGIDHHELVVHLAAKIRNLDFRPGRRLL